MADGQIVFEVTADGKHAIANIKDITSAIQKEAKKWDDAAEESTGNIEKSFSGLLKKLVAGFSAVKIGKALLDIGKDAIQAASDLQEVQNVVDVTFGSGANKIEKWAKEAGNQFGLSETQAKKFASTMGAMLKSSGLAGEQITEVSTDLAGLAADMASFYNLDFDTAFQKIRSGIAGETEPLKQLGINMSVANLNAFALKQGLEKTFEQMTQGEQAMLRYQYLMNATADAQGDFARTSDGYANSVRQLETNLERLKTTLGKGFIDVVTQATGYLNTFIDKLLPDESKKSVLDKINDIELDTQTKVAEIDRVAREAQGLIDKLTTISGTNAGDALKKLAEGANTLNASSTSTWNSMLNALKSVDGLSNIFKTDAGKGVENLANALAGASVDTTKAEAWKTFLGALSDNADAVSKLTGTSVEETKKWLDGLSESVNSIDASDAEAWNKLLTTLTTGFAGNTPEGQRFIESLASQFLSLGADSEHAVEGLTSLGFSSEEITQKQKEWLETCKDLVRTIPGLSSIINTETGEITGGIGALEDYVEEWKTSQEKLAYWKAFYAKQDEQRQAQERLRMLEIEAGGAQKAIERQKKRLDQMRKELGIEGEGYDLVIRLNATGGQGILTENEKKWNEEVRQLGLLYHDAETAANTYTQAVADNAEAIEQLAAEEEYLIEKYGEQEQAAIEAAEALSVVERAAQGDSDALKTVTDAVDKANEALLAMSDYAGKVRNSVEDAVNKTVHGFEKITTPMQEAHQKTINLEADLNDLGQRTEKNAKEWDKLNEQINKYNSETVTSQRMAYNLEEQVKFMDEYLANLNKARELGISADILSELSDGSVESYDYLAALAEASPDEVKRINENYQKVIDKKKELTDQLTGQKLTADQVYQSMAAAAKAAVAELDLQQEASDNAGKTIAGIASGISSHVGEVEAAVNSIIEQLNRLDSWGISIDMGENFGTITFSGNSGSTETPDAVGLMGIDYVPRDNWYARLHEGERVLTAEENRVWNALRNGVAPGVDLDSLGGVMRDNIQPGGNVYLDGRQVGRVVSDTQGRSYKSLQRSGWQA